MQSVFLCIVKSKLGELLIISWNYFWLDSSSGVWLDGYNTRVYSNTTKSADRQAKMSITTITRWTLLLVAMVTRVHGDEVCDGSPGVSVVADPTDCSAFFICNGRQNFRFSCGDKVGPQEVFDPVSKTCVARGTEYDHSRCKSPVHTTSCRPCICYDIAITSSSLTDVYSKI